MNPNIAGLPSKRQSVMGWANTVGTKKDIEANDTSMKFKVAPESSKVRMELGRLGMWRDTKKETSD